MNETPINQTIVLRVGQTERSYIVHVPPGITQGKPFPVVLNFHGGGGNAALQIKRSLMDDVADRSQFLLIYPEGTPGTLPGLRTWNAGSCCGRAARERVDDVAFVRALMVDAAERWLIDPNRIYATGMSNGGMMAYRLACELSDKIAAIAVVSATLEVQPCTPSRPISVMSIHGTADDSVPFDGGASKNRWANGQIFNSVPASIAFWKGHDACPEEERITYQRGRVTCRNCGPCQGNTDVTLCVVEGGGHAWPGGTPPNRREVTDSDFNASEEIWRFLTRHQLDQ